MGESLLTRVGRWVKSTPLRSLEQAYAAALSIREIETQHFDGNAIVHDDGGHGKNTNNYFRIQLKKHLQTIDVRLAEFRASATLTNQADLQNFQNGSDPASRNGSPPADRSVLDQLAFIDQVTGRYSKRPPAAVQPAAPDPASDDPPATLAPAPPKKPATPRISTQTNILPRSIFRTFSLVRRELSPEFEAEQMNSIRDTRQRTTTSVRFLLLLALLPFLAQVLSKSFLFSPLVDHLFADRDPTQIVLSADLEERALGELQAFRDHLEFRKWLAPQDENLDDEVGSEEERIREKAQEIFRKYSYQNVEGLKNALADLFSLGVFGWLIYTGKQEVETLKSFIDHLVYGLSDSAKAFVIILFTDIFVGYHSPHGWEVLLKTMAHHLGVPENQDLIFAFIATVPVVMDTVFKYWIFRGLNKISPSAVATYKNMNGA